MCTESGLRGLHLIDPTADLCCLSISPGINASVVAEICCTIHAGGLVYGFVGAGGNTGGAVTQAIFFSPHNLAPYESFKWLGRVAVVTHCPPMTARS